nr:sulfatase [Polycladospora coralii]
MMTGKHPYHHGIVNMKPLKIPNKLIPLPLYLQKTGYKTAAVDCNHRITGKYNPWFKRGYDTYLDPSEKKKTHLNLTAQEINQCAIPWIRKHRNEKNTFLFLHYWDPHFPYITEEEFTKWSEQNALPTNNHEEDIPMKVVSREPLYSFIKKYNGDKHSPQKIRQNYDGTVKQVDQAIGELVNTLKETNQYEDTLILLVSDHGESLGEHKIYFDHHGLYDQTLHVPFILSCPAKLPKKKRITEICQHEDIFPTICQLANVKSIPQLGKIDGKSMMSIIEGKQKKFRSFAVSCEANWQLKRSIRTKNWKLIQSLEQDVYGNPKWELYNLQQDPKETKNVVNNHPKIFASLKRTLLKWVQHNLSQYKLRDPLRIGIKVRLHRATVAEEEKVKKRLSELGY